ncbi:MAG TPA: TolC family protein [Synergistales bacterium]|nr:TolC family protein [Synergistales bacterium]
MKRLFPCGVFLGMLLAAPLPAMANSLLSSGGYLALVAEKNPELAASASRVESLYRLVEAVTGSTRPRLGLVASSGRILREGEGESTLSLSLGKRLDLSGLDALRIRQAELAAEIQEARHAEFAASLMREAETAYWNAAAGKSTVALYASLLAQRQEDLRIARLRFEQGTAARLDVFRAEVQVEKTRAAKTEAEAALRDALSLMARLAGGEAVEPSEIPARFETTLSADLEAAWKARPDARRAALEREAAAVATRIAALGMNPVLEASLASTLLSDSSTVVPPESDLLFSLRMEVPLYDGGQTRAEKQSRRILETAAEQDERALRVKVAMELAQASSRLAKAQALEMSRRKEVDLASEELRITRLRYRTGVGSQLELLDAQVREQAARTAYLDALREMAVARAQLSYALGLSTLPKAEAGSRPSGKE